MAFSKFLTKRKKDAIELLNLLSSDFDYVSILGSDIKAKNIMKNRMMESISEGSDTACGFTIKLNKGGSVFEYSLDDINKDKKKLKEKIINDLKLDDNLKKLELNINLNDNEKLEQNFVRKNDLNKFSDEELLSISSKIVEDTLALDNHFVNVNVNIAIQDVSKLFVSKTKILTQNYSWVNGMIMGVYKSDNSKTIMEREGTYSYLLKDVIKDLPKLIKPLQNKCMHLIDAKPIKAGLYDVITDPSISGLIAHEAFGHGVEMDQFVKDRAKGKYYVGKYVASKVVNMKDGAACILPGTKDNISVASYFFDDDGILAKDTQIIKDGILVSGISDFTSSSILNTTPTGNGRRESYKRKAYSRMTNTYFEAGNDKLEDMIKSIKHGYMLFETNNGMEDPKNWGIQCVCNYGIEIIDGKLTENYVSPVVMSGYVPDLLKSITMVSDSAKVIGSGSCGKGYKEWVRVSDGGPHLKAKVKLA